MSSGQSAVWHNSPPLISLDQEGVTQAIWKSSVCGEGPQLASTMAGMILGTNSLALVEEEGDALHL